MTNSDGRVQRLELEVRDLRRLASQLLARLTGVEQAGRVLAAGGAGYQPDGGGGAAPLLGVAAANIAPRAAAIAAGGTLNLVAIDPDTRALAATGATLAVANPSSSTFSSGVSIKAGQYCAAVKIGDAWIAYPLEC